MVELQSRHGSLTLLWQWTVSLSLFPPPCLWGQRWTSSVPGTTRTVHPVIPLSAWRVGTGRRRPVWSWRRPAKTRRKAHSKQKRNWKTMFKDYDSLLLRWSYSWGYVTTRHWWTVVGSMGLLMLRCLKLRCNQTLKWPSVPLTVMHGFQPSKFQMSRSSDSFCLVPALAASFFSLSSSPSCLWSCLRECEVSQVKSVYFNHPSHGNSADY